MSSYLYLTGRKRVEICLPTLLVEICLMPRGQLPTRVGADCRVQSLQTFANVGVMCESDDTPHMVAAENHCDHGRGSALVFFLTSLCASTQSTKTICARDTQR